MITRISGVIGPEGLVIFDHPYNGGYARGCHGLVHHALRSASGADAQTNRAPHVRAECLALKARPALLGANLRKVLGGGHPGVPHRGMTWHSEAFRKMRLCAVYGRGIFQFLDYFLRI